MPDGTVSYQGAVLAFTRWGNGDKILLAFHGFGQTRTHFHPLAEALGDNYTLYAFDLFFHGESKWPQRDIPVSKIYWWGLLQVFLQQEGVSRFGLVGFSMGAKLVLAALEAFPEKTTQVMLIAPDGIKLSFWYRLATHPGWPRRWFRHVIVRPQAFRALVRTFGRLGVVDKSVLRFARSQMLTREQRLRVYVSWTGFRELKFSIPHIASLMNRASIPLVMYLGVHDRLVTRKTVAPFLKKLTNHRLIMLPAGHTRLIEGLAQHYLKYTNLLEIEDNKAKNG